MQGTSLTKRIFAVMFTIFIVRQLIPPVTKKQQVVTKSKKNTSEPPIGRKRKSFDSDRSLNSKRGKTVQCLGDKLAKITDEIHSITIFCQP